MIKVKISNVKKVKPDIKFLSYPLKIYSDNIIIKGEIKLNLLFKEINVRIDKVYSKITSRNESCICLPDTKIDKYCLKDKEKLALLKEIFKKFINNSQERLFPYIRSKL